MSSIHEYIQSIRIIDGHEHVNTASARRAQQTDLFGLLHYFDSDLVTAGMPRDALHNPKTSVEEKARIFLTYFRRANNTAYAKAFRTAMADLYQMEEWSESSIVELNERVLRATNDPSWYDTVLHQKAGIDKIITLVDQTQFDDPAFRSIMFLDDAFAVKSLNAVSLMEQNTKRSISTLAQYVDALHVLMDGYVADGMVGTKLGYAYQRTLAVDKPTFHEAEVVFNRIQRLQYNESLSLAETKPLQDFLIHEVIRASIDRKLPIQIHTGHHETSVSRNGNILTNSNVTQLIPLLLEYTEAKFVLLHASLPYVDEYASIVKNFPNAYADMTWVYIISPTVATRVLHQLIEMVPWTKIQGFGGDYSYVEGIYAHAKMARQILGNVLEQKIVSGYFTEEEARQFARGVLRENLLDIYSLSL